MSKEQKTASKHMENHAARLRAAFIEYFKEKGSRPKSFMALNEFAKLGIQEGDFPYKKIEDLEKAVWLRWFEETIAVLENSPEYHEYSAREKLLAFYFTWMDTIKPSRDYILKAPHYFGRLSAGDKFLSGNKQVFQFYAEQLVKLALANEEISKRPLLPLVYAAALWEQFMFIMNFWISDKSEGQGRTDEAIERAVNLFFELAGHNQLDSIIDFGKFLFKKS